MNTKEYANTYAKAYRASAHGKSVLAKYIASGRGRISQKKHRATAGYWATRALYRKSEKSRAATAKYLATPKYKAGRAAYMKSPRGLAAIAKYRAKPEAKKLVAEWRSTTAERAKQKMRFARIWETPAGRAAYLRRYILRKYKLSMNEYWKMVGDHGGLCAICESKNIGGWRLGIDHDHKTGKVRGLLCNPCNAGLGNFRDKIQTLYRAADYLEIYSRINIRG